MKILVKKKKKKKLVREIYLNLGLEDLPRYVKSLCPPDNYINYLKFIESRRLISIKRLIL